jgi:RNA polymerase sigma factor (sigma-70 family)
VAAVAPGAITDLLLAWGQGDDGALERLTPLVYAELRRVARCHTRAERSDHTLETNASAHEAYVRLIDARRVDAADGLDLVALDDALEALARLDARKGQVVELRFFGGLTVAETASVLQVSEDTVGRDWSFVKSWLRRELAGSVRIS